METEPCKPLTAATEESLSQDGEAQLTIIAAEEEGPWLVEALPESNLEFVAVEDTHIYKMNRKGTFYWSTETELEEQCRDLKGYIRLPISPITTETDIDITAALLPSGRIQSHHHVKTAVSETVPTEVQEYEPCFYNGFSKIHQEVDAYDSHHLHLSLHSNVQSHCSERSNFSKSTVPFSFGNNSRSTFLQQPLEPIDYNLSKFEAQTQVEKMQIRSVHSLIDQQKEESVKNSVVKNIDDVECIKSVTPCSRPPMSLEGRIIPTVYSEEENMQICDFDIYNVNIHVNKGPYSDLRNMPNLNTTSHSEEVCVDTFINEDLNLENITCESNSTPALDAIKQSVEECQYLVYFPSVAKSTTNQEELQKATSTLQQSDFMTIPQNGLNLVVCCLDNSGRTFGKSKGGGQLIEDPHEVLKNSGVIWCSEINKLENPHFAKPSGIISSQLCEIKDYQQELGKTPFASGVNEHILDQTLLNKTSICELMPELAVENQFSESPSLEIVDLGVQINNQCHYYNRVKCSNEANCVGKDEMDSYLSADDISDHKLDQPSDHKSSESVNCNLMVVSTVLNATFQDEPSDQISSESVKHNLMLDSTVLKTTFQDADIGSEKTNENRFRRESPLTPGEPVQESIMRFKDTDPRSQPRNSDLLRIAISPASVDYGVACLMTEPLSYWTQGAKGPAHLTSAIVMKISVQDAYGIKIKECGHSFLEELRRAFLDAEGDRFTLLDSGLVLSRCKKYGQGRTAFITMCNGIKMALTIPRSSLFPYYHLGMHFYVTEQLTEDWFRIRDRVTQESMLMKKVPVISNWKKLLQNFLYLPHHPLMLVPYAVLYDRNDSILYLMEDRHVSAVGTPPDRCIVEKGKLFGEFLSYMRYCKWNNIYPEDDGTNMIYTPQGVCFDPSGLLNSEDPCVFKKTFKEMLRLLFFEDQQDLSAVETMVSTACQLMEEDREWTDPM
ncbi:hypothetical protein NDU88_007212 [Pleurodeles waltl]|uniref:Uncharacterized protein n=1 Tax=Pleurodeles waltl TaxID=8319 RepID=A0AAV7QMB0_PLEWA|nr:hypothetical protein NDU88_007212 [Pleurodeles waltl]